MSFKKLFSLLDRDELKSLVINFDNMNEKPFIIKETLEILKDDSPYINIISDNNKISLCNMINSYLKNCYMLYLDDLKLQNVLDFGELEIYKISAPLGLRYATEKEVSKGVKNLIPEKIYPAGEKEYRMLSLLEWTFSGKMRYIIRLGYKIEYNGNTLITPFIDIINNIAEELLEMFNFIKDSNKIKKSIKILSKTKKNKGYKYSTFAKDEVDETLTIKQLFKDILDTFPKNSSNSAYRYALHIALKSIKKNKYITPYEISKLRTIYELRATETIKKSLKNQDIRNKCDVIKKERNSGKIDKDNFVFKIISTLDKYNYNRVSPKQLSIIDEAYNKLVDKKEETEVITDNDIDDFDVSLSTLSDAIGEGLFND